MGTRYLLDTNTIIDYIGNKLPNSCYEILDTIIDAQFQTSIIVKIEVLGFNGDVVEMQKLSLFLNLADIFYVNDSIANKTIELRKQFRKLNLGDAIIAATALVHNLTIISRNTKDFENIAGLTVINPYLLNA